MSVGRLRQQGRIEPVSNISSRPSKHALDASPQSQDAARINADLIMIRPSIVRGPPHHKRRTQPILPASWSRQPLQPAAFYSAMQEMDTTGCALDIHLGRAITSSPYTTTIVRRNQRCDTKLEGGPTTRSTTYEQPQQPMAESKREAIRSRQRVAKESSPAAHPGAKMMQHFPFPQNVYNTDDSKKRLFACPFYKSDPDTYRDCRRFELTRVKDVKQHLQRKHCPPSYCNRCYKVFGTKESLADHQRGEDRCERRDGPLPGSISEQQWEQLNQQYQSRGKPVEKQWEDFWHILFPGRDPPRSVYQDSELEETISRMLVFWSINKEDIASRSVRKAGTKAARFSMDDPDSFVPLFDEFLEDFFGQFNAETGNQSACAAAAVKSMDQHLQVRNPHWRDDGVSTVFPVAGDPYFTLSSNLASPCSDQLLALEAGPPPRWEPQQPFSPLDREMPGSESTHSLHDGYSPEPTHYHVTDNPNNHLHWLNHSDLPDVQMCGATNSWKFLDSQGVTIPTVPSAPAHYRYTWPPPNAAAWSCNQDPGGWNT